MNKEDVFYAVVAAFGLMAFVALFAFAFASDASKNAAKVECVKITQKPVECVALFK